jgi:hypothetical protein
LKRKQGKDVLLRPDRYSDTQVGSQLGTQRAGFRDFITAAAGGEKSGETATQHNTHELKHTSENTITRITETAQTHQKRYPNSPHAHSSGSTSFCSGTTT